MRFALPAPLSRDKQDTLLLVAASLLVLVPHAAHLPAWVSALCGATLAWRAGVTLLGRRLPSNLVLVPIAAAAMAGVLREYHTLLGRDAGVAMLVLLVAFKMLEMHARRDLFVVVFLCYFLVLTNFFYSQSIPTAMLMLASIVALLATQLSFQLTGAVPPLRTRLWMGAKVLALALPLAGAAFVLFPRIEGPLWGMPDDAHASRTGLSDTMAPGQMSDLAQSEDVAFRVKFDGPVPPQPQLYWRGPVLGDYDGRTWTRVLPSQHAEPLSLSVGGKPVGYEVTLEASNTRWLFALEMPRALPELPGRGVGLSDELEFQALAPISDRVRYHLASYVHYSLQPQATAVDGRWLSLPYGVDPRARAAGQALTAEPDPARRVAAVLRRFARDGFVYTLHPPLLPGPDSIDDFLYGTRAGFCEHYAGAFVFLMRAAGVPARVVTGYQGGDLNPIDGYLTVRQSDAHAWAEVWLPRRGWVRVDPTAAVAPGRVEHSLARALPPMVPFGLDGLAGLLQPDPGSLLGRIRYAIGAVNNGWNQWVLNYTPQRQQRLVDRLQEGLSHWQSLALLTMLCALLFLVRKFSQRRKADPVDALYSMLCQRLGQLGLPRAPDEGPTAYAGRLDGAGLAPEPSAAAAEFLRRYSAYRYGPQSPGTGLVPILRDLLSRVR
ncbi:transglutaminaseTgpA domain-containing protein [Massilia pinisoli]|uniref:TransglutaminaseTgpA domain-containing protein n=1 Tax=Massilia pinisoli TaxID=1772194 RepID=A0ABT1ZVP0_9BURK|nr:transglutaminaseTgpA domain-containing protein [Massilia pinisoli]MCS0583929.1 transglutaminaseTgpA domain-containing protein [Massilia pinisoli]